MRVYLGLFSQSYICDSSIDPLSPCESIYPDSLSESSSLAICLVSDKARDLNGGENLSILVQSLMPLPLDGLISLGKGDLISEDAANLLNALLRKLLALSVEDLNWGLVAFLYSKELFNKRDASTRFLSEFLPFRIPAKEACWYTFRPFAMEYEIAMIISSPSLNARTSFTLEKR